MRVGRHARRRVYVAVRRADDQQPAGSEHAPKLGQEAVLLGQVFERFERHNNIERGTG
jgi:hypothetical protein